MSLKDKLKHFELSKEFAIDKRMKNIYDIHIKRVKNQIAEQKKARETKISSLPELKQRLTDYKQRLTEVRPRGRNRLNSLIKEITDKINEIEAIVEVKNNRKTTKLINNVESADIDIEFITEYGDDYDTNLRPVVADLLNRVKDSYKNDGHIKKEYVKGSFNNSNMGKGKTRQVRVNVHVDNPLSLIALLDYLTLPVGTKIDLGELNNLTNYPKDIWGPPILKSIKKKINSLSQLKDYGEVLEELLVNPDIYKQNFDNIRLFDARPMGLSKYDTQEYAIADNCVQSFLSNNYGLHVPVDTSGGVLFKNLRDILDSAKISYKFRDIAYNVIQENITKKGKYLNAIIHNKHLYVLNNYQDKFKTIGSKSISDISEIVGKYQRYIVQDFSLWQAIANSRKSIAVDDSDDNFYYDTNLVTYVDPEMYDLYIRAEADWIKLHPKSKFKFKSGYSYLESLYNLKGSISTDYFSNVDKVRVWSEGGQYNFSTDINKAYSYQLINTHLPVPSLDDCWQVYSGQKLRLHGFYYIEIKPEFTDKLLAPWTDVYSGYELQILLNEKRVTSEDIKFQFVTSRYQVFSKYLSRVENADDHRINIRYIGWIMKNNTMIRRQFNMVDQAEYDSLKYKYGRGHYEFNRYSFYEQYFRSTTGILANLMIKCKTNIELYLKNKQMEGKLIAVATDELFYAGDPSLASHSLEPGKFKVVTSPKEWMMQRKDQLYSLPLPVIPDMAIKYVSVTKDDDQEMLDLIANGKSFQIQARPGYGKTYKIQNKIIPHLQSMGKKYLITGTTIESAEAIKGVTIQSLTKRNMHEIKSMQLDYIIIDESSQIRSHDLYCLNKIKEWGVKLILVGDKYQCRSPDCSSITWILTDYCINLCDNTIVEINGKSQRYDERTEEMLNKLIDSFDNHEKMLDITREYVKNSSVCNRKICFTNEKCKEVGGKTVHSVQGKSIDEPYTIYEVDRMPPDVLYTVLSRTTKFEYINIYSESSDILLAPLLSGVVPVPKPAPKYKESAYYGYVSQIQHPKFVVRNEYRTNNKQKAFKNFDSPQSFFEYLDKLPEYQRTYHEVLLPDDPQYFRIDIDCKPRHGINTDMLFEGVIVAISEIFQEFGYPYDIVVKDSSNQDVFSRHIIVKCKYPFRNNEECKTCFRKFLATIREEYKPYVAYIDTKPYGSIQSFRLPDNHKVDSDRTAKVISLGHTRMDALLHCYDYEYVLSFTARPKSERKVKINHGQVEAILTQFIENVDIDHYQGYFNMTAGIHHAFAGNDAGYELLEKYCKNRKKWSEISATYKRMRAVDHPITMNTLRFMIDNKK